MKQLTGYFKTTILLAALTAFLAGVGYFMGGSSGMMIALLFALVINGGMYWFSDSLVLKMAGAQPMKQSTHPEIYSMTRRLSKKMNIPMPKLYTSAEQAPNAFATGRTPSKGVVCVTQGLLDHLNPEEVEGVIAHELAHIKNYDTLISTVAAVFSGAIASMMDMLFWSNLFGGGNNEEEDQGPMGAFGGIAMMIIAPIIASLIQFAISRSREFEADATAARATGQPMYLASALLSIENSLRRNPHQEQAPAVAALSIQNSLQREGLAELFSTHPNTSARVRRLNAIASELGAPQMTDSNMIGFT